MKSRFAASAADCGRRRYAKPQATAPSARLPAWVWRASFPADRGGRYCSLDGQACQPDPALCRLYAAAFEPCPDCGEPLRVRVDTGAPVCRECLLWE